MTSADVRTILSNLQQSTTSDGAAMVLNAQDGSQLGVHYLPSTPPINTPIHRKQSPSFQATGFLENKDNKAKTDELAKQVFGLIVDSRRLLATGSSANSKGSEKLKRLIVNIGSKEVAVTADNQFIYVIVRALE
ncbi:hypothetical protein HDU79_003685 [Rhizoclosmatium sp. JEL0117]|nr:hypothetical protein HDU79_003685 [Rhizoclosmatium sp. JEL0117]